MQICPKNSCHQWPCKEHLIMKNLMMVGIQTRALFTENVPLENKEDMIVVLSSILAFYP